jgi:hypothetical protein
VALISVGESKWRMLRRVLRKKRFAFADCRNQARFDKSYFDWLVENGFYVAAGTTGLRWPTRARRPPTSATTRSEARPEFSGRARTAVGDFGAATTGSSGTSWFRAPAG